MKHNLLQYIILYAIVACVALVLATLARISATSMGFDSFTAFMVFIIILVIEMIVYLSIHVILQELMLPWIGKGLSKIPYFRNKEKPASNFLNMEEIRKDNANEKEKKLEVATHYTQKTFAPYATDEEINRLCDYIGLYVDKLKMKDLKPIKINNQLASLDIFHFGWNIWNHFRIGKQDDIASFLKIVFARTLREVEVETIKKHLKDEERKGIIKIQENIR